MAAHVPAPASTPASSRPPSAAPDLQAPPWAAAPAGAAGLLEANPPTGFSENGYHRPGRPLPLPQRLRVHDHVIRRLRHALRREGCIEVPVPGLTPATGLSGIVESLLTLDYQGALAFPRQTGQLYLEEVVAAGVAAVYCEGASYRGDSHGDGHHLSEYKLIEVEKRDMNLDGLCTFQETLLKDVAGTLTAEQIGGANVTRLDRMLRAEHPRMTYREALGLLRRRGFPIEFGDGLDRQAAAILVYHCGRLPVHITHAPDSLKPFNARLNRDDPAVVDCVDYLLPFSGETFGGAQHETDIEVLRRRLYSGTMYAHLMRRAQEFARTQRLSAAREGVGGARPSLADLVARHQGGIREAFDRYLKLCADAPAERAGFGLNVARLLQYFMGLDSMNDAVVFPADNRSFGAAHPAARG